jgi:ribosomal protein S18 acetylase RimI-like enzyme
MHIRPAEQSDYSACCALEWQITDLHAQEHPEIFRSTREAMRTQEEFAKMLVEPAAIYVAEEDGKVVAYLELNVQDAPGLAIMTPRRFVKVDTLVVDTAYQHRGIGRALMGVAEEWARAHMASQLMLNVYKFNLPAVELYEKLGYRAISQRMEKTLT